MDLLRDRLLQNMILEQLKAAEDDKHIGDTFMFRMLNPREPRIQRVPPAPLPPGFRIDDPEEFL